MRNPDVLQERSWDGRQATGPQGTTVDVVARVQLTCHAVCSKIRVKADQACSENNVVTALGNDSDIDLIRTDKRVTGLVDMSAREPFLTH